MTSFTYGSLFSGIGGIDLGLDRAGFQCAFQVEINEYASKVLTKHWPDVARFRDVRDCGAHNLPSVDLLAGGFPCQPHSVAGKRQASADERDLWGEFHRLICEIKPAWVLAENVPGLLSSENGRFFGRVLRDLAQSGYDAEWQVLSAAQFGALHLRRRVFIVAYTNSQQSQRGREHRVLACTSRQSEGTEEEWQRLWNAAINSREDVSNTSSTRLEITGQSRRIPPTKSEGAPTIFERRGSPSIQRLDYWAVEPSVCRMVDGFSSRVDRIKGLGNAVVPQVAEYIGRCIMTAIQRESEVSA